MLVNRMRSVFSLCAVCSADCRSTCWAVVARLNDKNRIATYIKNGQIATDFSERSEPSLHTSELYCL